MRVLDEYFEALRTQDWARVAPCLAEDVHRTGPYLDEVRGREAYVKFLASAIGALRSYELRVHRVRELAPHSAVVELSEAMDRGGERREFPELLLFDFDAAGRIARVDVYIKQPPRRT